MNNSQVFSKRLKDFFLEYLPKSKGCSSNTIHAYQYAFLAFFRFLDEKFSIKHGELDLDNFTFDVVSSFLSWSQAKQVSDSTRNQRQSAINSFAKYLLNYHPELIYELNKITNIPVKKSHTKVVSYIKLDGINEILKCIDQSSVNGRRDYLIIELMSILGLRVSEVISIRVCDISFAVPPSLKVLGKGNKERYVPLSDKLIMSIDSYLNSAGLGNPNNSHRLLFPSRHLTKMTRQNLSHIVDKYSRAARLKMMNDGRNYEVIPDKVTPHMLRHSAAMNMLQNNDINLLVVKEILGHTSIRATEIYAQATNEQVQAAVNKITQVVLPEEQPEWTVKADGSSIEDWLNQQVKDK